MGRVVGCTALAAVLAIGFAGTPAGAGKGPGLAPGHVSAAPGTAVAAGNSRPRPVTLINGDQLLAGAERGGGMSHELIAGTARGMGAALATMTLGGRTCVVPADALPYLGRGLDPGLFDIASLLRDQAGDVEQAGIQSPAQVGKRVGGNHVGPAAERHGREGGAYAPGGPRDELVRHAAAPLGAGQQLVAVDQRHRPRVAVPRGGARPRRGAHVAWS